jgi:hypothetical protein
MFTVPLLKIDPDFAALRGRVDYEELIKNR